MQKGEQDYIFCLDDPRLSDEEREALFDIGCKLYGDPGQGLNARSPITVDEVEERTEKLRADLDAINERVRRAEEGAKKADIIMGSLLDEAVTAYGQDKVIQANPIDVFTLVSIINKAMELSEPELQKLAAHGAKFDGTNGRQKGSVDDHNAYVHKLRKDNPTKTAKELHKVALDEAAKLDTPFRNTNSEDPSRGDLEVKKTGKKYSLPTFIKNCSK